MSVFTVQTGVDPGSWKRVGGIHIYYPPEVRSMKYCIWEYLGRNALGSSLNSANRKKNSVVG